MERHGRVSAASHRRSKRSGQRTARPSQAIPPPCENRHYQPFALAALNCEPSVSLDAPCGTRASPRPPCRGLLRILPPRRQDARCGARGSRLPERPVSLRVSPHSERRRLGASSHDWPRCMHYWPLVVGQGSPPCRQRCTRDGSLDEVSQRTTLRVEHL